MNSDTKIEIDMDKPCQKCGQMGAAGGAFAFHARLI